MLSSRSEIDAIPSLRRLKFRGVWLPVGAISLLLLAKGAIEFIQVPHWTFHAVAIGIGTIGLIVAGAYLFLNSIFSIVREREKAIEERNRQALTLERRFRALIENSSDGVVLADPHGKTLYASASTSRILGYSPEELAEGRIFDLTHPDDREASEARFTQVLQRPGEFVSGSFRAWHKNGSWQWMEGVTSNLLADPSVQGIVSNFRDITERKLGEQALKAVNQRLTSVLESITDAYFALDEQWRFIEFNPVAEQAIFRRPTAELLGKVLWEEFPHLAGTEFNRQLEAATTEKRYAHFESSSGLVEGKWFEVHIYPRDGRAEVYLRDVTRRKMAEEEREQLLRKIEQERYRAEALAARDEAILINMTEGLVIFDLDGAILDMNPAALRMHGLEPARGTQKQGRQFPASFGLQSLDGRPVAAEESPVARVLRGETFTANEAKAQRRDTGALWIGSYSGTLARDKGGRPLLGVVTFHDVTAQKQAEAALEERARLATLTAEVGRSFVGADDLRTNLRRCVEATVHHLDAAFTLIWTTNEETQLLELQASAGLPTSLKATDGSISLGQVNIGQIARDQRPLLTNRALDDTAGSDQDWVRREGLVAFAGIPLVAGDHLVGALAVFARHPMTDAAFLGLVSIASEIALNIERVWTKETLRRTNEELERRVHERTAELAQSNRALHAEIAERRRVEEALRESQARLSAIISSAMDAIIVLDAHQRTVLFNAAAEKIFRCPAAEAIGQPLERFLPEQALQVHPEDVQAFG
ncbi:MAG TPA: PAS domain S-box protein, partial [archaeon]|nr:PAS domain S-box protein [archaeon]